MQINDFAIRVTTAWNGWQSLDAPLDDLSDIHWHQPKGAPWPLLHAYVSCASLPAAVTSHACDQVSAPHRIRVCVLRSHNVPLAYAEVLRRAAPSTAPIGGAHVDVGRARAW
jgi:hypothetical protein